MCVRQSMLNLCAASDQLPRVDIHIFALTASRRRDGSLLVDEAAIMPSADELIWEAESGIDTSRPQIEDPDESVSDPIEAIEDDFDEPDVPAVDLA